MGEFIIECYESGSIDYPTASILICRYDPLWSLELTMARELLEEGDC